MNGLNMLERLMGVMVLIGIRFVIVLKFFLFFSFSFSRIGLGPGRDDKGIIAMWSFFF